MTKQKQVQQIKIDLEKDCISPRKEIVDAYDKAGANDIWVDRDILPEYRNNLRLHTVAKGSGNKIVRKISNSIERGYRMVLNGCCSIFNSSTKDHWGNSLGIPVLLGKYDLPEFDRTYSFDPCQKRTTSGPEDMGPTPSVAFVNGHKEVYTYPWESVKDQILEWRKDGTIVDTALVLSFGSGTRNIAFLLLRIGSTYRSMTT